MFSAMCMPALDMLAMVTLTWATRMRIPSRAVTIITRTPARPTILPISDHWAYMAQLTRTIARPAITYLNPLHRPTCFRSTVLCYRQLHPHM